MPSDDFWSPSMLLRWVLTRDEDAVERMLRQYGGPLVGIRFIPAPERQPAPTWNDVIAQYELKVPKTAKNKELSVIIVRSMILTTATQQIYSALQRGAVEMYGRANGSGDVERIAPAEWTRLRFFGIEGHDVALPGDVNNEQFILSRPIADYLSWSVPPTNKPTVWIDPECPSAQALKEWPAFRDGQETSRVRQPEPSDDVIFRTGAPGRPSSMHLILAEFERRCDNDACELSLAQEARALHAWLCGNYPTAPPPSPGTIETRIRKDYNAWKANHLRPEGNR
jgi:hypothetical protein